MKKWLVPISLGLLLVSRVSARAEVGADATLFGHGRTHISVSGGYGSSNNNSYLVLGLGAGYYLFDGLEAGLQGEAWLASKPHIYKVTPQLTYYLTGLSSFTPYLGGFYRHTFYDSLNDLDSAGGRAGAAFALGPHAYVSAGLVYERQFHCNTNTYGTCSQVYPEAGFSLSY